MFDTLNADELNSDSVILVRLNTDSTMLFEIDL
jgi:hypothetical protein